MTDLKITRDFAPNPLHGYNLPPDTEVQSAKFGRIRVDIWRDPEPITVFRGDPPRVVGSWPDRNWRYVVEGVMSGVAATEAGAKSKGELTAWRNQSNAPTVIDGEALVFAPGLLRHQLSLGEMAIDEGVLATQRDLIMARFPAEGVREQDPQEFAIPQRAPLSARVDRVISFGPDPVLALMSRTGEDGVSRELIACALPETDGRGWSYVVSEPQKRLMEEWKKESIDLRDLQLDPQTTHYVTREADLMFSPGSRVSLIKVKGAMPEAWLPDAGVYPSMFEKDMSEPETGLFTTIKGSESERPLMDLRCPDLIRDQIRDAFRVPEGVTLSLFEGARPDWLMDLAWDGDETVQCGDRFYAAPGWDGFTLVALMGGEPVGYLSADLSLGSSGGVDLHVDMIQISADHRGQRLGSALMAGLAELAAREIDAQRTRGAEPDWSVSADTQSEAAGRLTDRLQTVLDDLVEPCVEVSPDRLEEGPQT
jgi:GNAT superfamily N-acetyltransferase